MRNHRTTAHGQSPRNKDRARVIARWLVTRAHNKGGRYSLPGETK